MVFPHSIPYISYNFLITNHNEMDGSALFCHLLECISSIPEVVNITVVDSKVKCRCKLVYRKTIGIATPLALQHHWHCNINLFPADSFSLCLCVNVIYQLLNEETMVWYIWLYYGDISDKDITFSNELLCKGGVM